MADPIRDALAELVACKDLKDKIDGYSGYGFKGRLTSEGMEWEPAKYQHDLLEAEYNRRKPLAWEAARLALSTTQGVPAVPVAWIDPQSLARVCVRHEVQATLCAVQSESDWLPLYAAVEPSVLSPEPEKQQEHETERSGEAMQRPAGIEQRLMVVCAVCGNKRCPRAGNDTFVCTGSNAPNQIRIAQQP